MDPFYQDYPDFDWEFYLSCYSDLIEAGIIDEQGAKHHYAHHGHKENRRTHSIIKKKSILQKIPMQQIITKKSVGIVSKALVSLESRFLNTYGLKKEYNENDPTFFFGMYTDEDLQNISNHKGLKFIIWGGEDVNLQNENCISTLQEISYLPNCIHISISHSIYQRLQKFGYSSLYVDFNLVDTSIFYPIPKNELGRKIYIFNGQTKDREHLYGKEMYDQVLQCLPRDQFIFSNSKLYDYEIMPSIYKQCFIMLRLTDRDGNANSAQECNAMKIPVVHNHSPFGLKWKNINDILKHIKNHRN